MIELKDKKNCSGCTACTAVCPAKCIFMERDKEGFLYPEVDVEKCIECGLCDAICPILNPSIKSSEIPNAYAAINKDKDVRLKSASGGIFTILAEDIVSRGGIVFGAAFSDDFKSVKHIGVTDIAGIEMLRGSKYLQSNIGNAYSEAEKFLKESRPVLFSGTPCQIGGLKAYLKKEYENLYTLDMVCHGIPSPKVWGKYIKRLEEEKGGRILDMSFRDKRDSWAGFSLVFDFSNGNNYAEVFNKNLYMRAFLSNIDLRPSCYDCRFKGLKRESDITLADFWGIKSMLPDLDDDCGTSLVFVQTPKGEEILMRNGEKLERVLVDAEKAVKYNPAAIQSVALPKQRKAFMKKIDKKPIEFILEKYSAKSHIRIILGKICGRLRKILK